MGDKRTLAQFFFEVGYGSCFAEAMIRNDCKPPFKLTDAMIERAWEIAPECHDDGHGFDERLALANSAHELLEALRLCIPVNVCLTNPNICDDLIVPLDVPMGDLRKIAAVIAKAQGTPTTERND